MPDNKKDVTKARNNFSLEQGEKRYIVVGSEAKALELMDMSAFVVNSSFLG